MGRSKKILLLCSFFFTAQTSYAGLLGCIIDAANEYNLPANDLLAIASAEGGKNGDVRWNRNGTADMGVFQINTVHWSDGGKFKGIIPPEKVLNDGCYAAKVAAYIVKSNYIKYPKTNKWVVLSYYHSKNQTANRIYREKLQRYSTQWAAWLIKNYPNHKIVY